MTEYCTSAAKVPDKAKVTKAEMVKNFILGGGSVMKRKEKKKKLALFVPVIP